MATWVKKFGGSSLATVERMQHAADTVAESVQQGHQVVVVVSAMLGETDRLLSLCSSVASDAFGRDKAALLATGEQVSAALFALVLQQKGISAISLHGAQAGIVTSDQYARADIQEVNRKLLLHYLSDSVPVVTGYQGVNAQGEFTTLGRGGSDLTAVAVAHAIGADECQIYTDVEGVYAADPRVVADAGLIKRLYYSEMLALAHCGAKVLQMRAVEYGSRFDVPLRVLSSFVNGQGTLIVADDADREASVIVGIGVDRRQATFLLQGLRQVDFFKHELLSVMEEKAIDIDMFTVLKCSEHASHVDVKFTVSFDDHECVAHDLRLLSSSFDFTFSVSTQNAKLSVVGLGLQSHAGIAADILSLFSREKIEFELVHSTACRISFVLSHVQVQAAAELLHQYYIMKEQIVCN